MFWMWWVGASGSVHWSRGRDLDEFTLEAPLEHVARTRTVTERVRHLDVCSTVLRGVTISDFYMRDSQCRRREYRS